MRSLRNIIALVLLLSITTSCGDDFLSLTPFAGYTTENFYETEDQIEQAVNALYPAIRGFHTGAFWQLGEFRSDNTTFQYNPSDRGAEAFESLDYFLAASNNGTFSGLWNSCYSTISRCHFVLESVDDVSFITEENKTQKLAETRFVRAFMYLTLTKNFGAVPLVDRVILTEEEAAPIRRSPVTDIYNQLILPDLEFAIANLPDKQGRTEEGRASADAARMVMADAYFVQRDYTSALPLLQSIVESGRYALMSNYRDVFDPAFGFNDEIIFNVQHNSEIGQGTSFFVNWLPRNSGTDLTDGVFVGSLTGKHIVTADMMRAYEDGDKRKDASTGVYEKDGEVTTYIRKYLFTPIGSSGSDIDIPVYRYADALLMYCEALIETQGGLPNEIFEILNSLRARAGLGFFFPGNPVPELNIDTEDKLKEAIRKERRVELAFEYKRFYDLVRWGILNETMSAHGEEMKEIQSNFLGALPEAYTNIPELIAIPFNQIELYGYSQNTGW